MSVSQPLASMTLENEPHIPCATRISITFTTSSSTISMSDEQASAPCQLVVTARILSSSRPDLAITLCTNASILDNGQHVRHDGLFWGAILPLRSTLDPDRSISLAGPGSPSYTRSDHPDLRQRDWMRFETVPPMGKGELVIKHDLTLERLFRSRWSLPKDEVKPGEKFQLRSNPKRLSSVAGWWCFGRLDEDLKDKKFAEWERPGKDGEISNLMPGDQRPDVEAMERQGWVFSEKFDDLVVTDETPNDVFIEFVE